MAEIELDPIPSILIESMRDIGYSFETALADIIDNAITANASEIDIRVKGGDEPAVAVIDNGGGLNREELLSAMRMGSTDPRAKRARKDLGRFGLGMKTASFSQCRKLTVVSVKDGERSAFSWDLDYVVECNAWNVLEVDSNAELPFSESFPSGGTVVLWEKLDRLNVGRNGKKTTDSFERSIAHSENHIALVFHRFLSGEPGCSKVLMRINGRVIEPIDPFNRKHDATIPGPEEPLPGGVTIQAYTLPHKSKYASQAEYEKYGLEGGYLKNQGIYLYRAKRLIIYGTWFNLAKKTAITQLCRVKIDIDNTKDEDWKIDIKKVSAQLPEEARNTIKRLLSRFSSPSKRVYKRRGAKQTTSAFYPAWNAVCDNGLTRYEINRNHPLIQELFDSMEVQEKKKMQAVLDLVEAGFPLESLFVEMSGSPEKITTPVVKDESFREMARDFFACLKTSGLEEQVILDRMNSAPVFADRWDDVLAALEIEEG